MLPVTLLPSLKSTEIILQHHVVVFLGLLMPEPSHTAWPDISGEASDAKPRPRQDPPLGAAP